jgi:hypothetical protein
MQLIVSPDGSLRCLYDEAIDLAALGSLSITRASFVEPDSAGRWFADLAPVSGPVLGPFLRRTDALAAEQSWLESKWLAGHG